MAWFKWFKKKEKTEEVPQEIEVEAKKENPCKLCGLDIDEKCHKQVSSGGDHFHVQCFRQVKKEASKMING